MCLIETEDHPSGFELLQGRVARYVNRLARPANDVHLPSVYLTGIPTIAVQAKVGIDR